jgi:hypothetical protein
MTIWLDEKTGTVLVQEGMQVEILLEGREGRLRAPVTAVDALKIAEGLFNSTTHVVKTAPLVDPARPFAVYLGEALAFRSRRADGQRVRELVARGFGSVLKVVDERSGLTYRPLVK